MHEDPHHSRSRSTQTLQTLESVSEARVTKTTQFGTSLTNCHPIVEELATGVTNPGAVDDVEAGPTVEEECSAQRNALESGRADCDE